ncbi:MAG: transcriptional repressor [Ruminococcaceae bacterium]|nr:transcriptional repressor [Oscillospiraceae bacterium]
MAYKTKQREAIESYLGQNRYRHATVSEIYEYLRHKGIGIGLSTVYRQLDRMCEEGLLHRYYIDDGTLACYQLKEECPDCRDDHYHLKCTECGKLLHMECHEMHGVAEHIEAEHDFILDREKTVFYGLCKECRK